MHARPLELSSLELKHALTQRAVTCILIQRRRDVRAHARRDAPQKKSTLQGFLNRLT